MAWPSPRPWHAGCPVGPSQLRRLFVTYVGFDGRAHRGQLIVNRAVTSDVAQVFRVLYTARERLPTWDEAFSKMAAALERVTLG